MARTNLSIDRRVFEEFATQAGRRNMTLFTFANESLSAISKISAEGGDPGELYRTWKAMTVLKEVDAIVLPSDFVEDLIKQIYRADKGRLLAKFSAQGTAVSALLRIAAGDLEGLISLAKGFFFLIPIKHFEVLDLQNGKIQVSVIGAGRAIEATECSNEFLKSVLVGYGYVVTKEEIHPGLIRLWAETPNRKNAAMEAPQSQA
jgi:hypothetical protein